jgi:hypothetical protein
MQPHPKSQQMEFHDGDADPLVGTLCIWCDVGMTRVHITEHAFPQLREIYVMVPQGVELPKVIIERMEE